MRDCSLLKVFSKKLKDCTILSNPLRSNFNRFLLAGLHLKSVFAYKTRKTRRIAVNALPKELNEAYEAEMGRLKRNERDYEIAKRALSWVYYAKRPLFMAELREAIAVDPIIDIENGDEDCRDLDPESLMEPREIIDCCGGLILWESSTDVVGFSHYTVSEFFAANAAGNIEPELYIARTCLTYLCFEVFNQGSCDDKDEFQMRVDKYQLAPYIGRFCGPHSSG